MFVVIGLLHRGTEKLISSTAIITAVPYFDRLDYISTVIQEYLWFALIERFYYSDCLDYTTWVRMINASPVIGLELALYVVLY